MKIDPNEPAIPCENVLGHTMTGLTIRAEIASRTFAAILSSPNKFRIGGKLAENPAEYAKIATDFADALISELNKEN